MGVNPELLKLARAHVKSAFVPAGDPSMGGDPAAAAGGGAPPMDPAAAGGAPPMDPAAAGGGGGDPLAMLQPMIQQAVQSAMASSGGGGGGGGEAAIKPKIDVNVEIMQIKKMLAKIVDALGIQIPAQDMVATPEDLTQMAEGGPGHAAMTPDSAGGGGGAIGQIQPMEPMKAAAEEWEQGVAFTPPPEYDFQNSHDMTRNTANLATAMLMRNRAKAS